MNAIGKIGVIIPELFDSLDLEMIHGIHTYARNAGYDLLIFSDTCNKTDQYQIYPDVISFGNIYQLAFQADLDGILFYASRFLSQDRKNVIYQELQKLDIPCIAVGEKTDLLPCITFSQMESIYMLTRHLIEEHHCRKLYCMTGFPDEYNSDERLAGFCKAMEEAGLSVNEDMIFYGSFWKEKSYQLGVDIAEGRIEKPDAIVCASDTMAVSLCEALNKYGISVPEDIAVTGYDGSWHTVIHSPKITTVCGRERQLGASAMCCLYEMINGKRMETEMPVQYIRYGTSCGCSPLLRDSDTATEEYLSNMILQWVNHKINMPINIISILSSAKSLDELMNTVYSFSFILKPVNEYAICLCDDWKFDFENTSSFRTSGFSERMKLALKCKTDGIEKQGEFSSRELLPELTHPHEPELIVFTSLHQNQQIFGYIATQYESALHICLDEHFVNWCNAVANGLDELQNRIYNKYIREQLAVLSVHDPTTGLSNKRGFMEQLPNYTGAPNFLLMISYYDKNDQNSRNFIEKHTLIANALRLSASSDELLGRIEKNVFAVLSPVKEENAKNYENRRIMQLEAKMREILGTVSYQQFPDLLTDISMIRFQKLNEAESFIEEHLRLVHDQTEASFRSSGNYMEKLYRLHREIWSEPQKELSVSDMADYVGISASHFQRIYKNEFGISCNKDIINARIEKAKWLLLHTELRVQEISNACGYNDNSHFMRQFREKVGMSALHYRNNTADNGCEKGV